MMTFMKNGENNPVMIWKTIMLDANAFDFIYANQLIDKIKSLVKENKIS